MTKGSSTFIVPTTWQYSVESALKKTTPMNDVLLWTFTKSRKCAKCIDSISSKTRSSLKKGKMTQIKAVFLKRSHSIRLPVIQNGLFKEGLHSKRSKSSKCYLCKKIKPRCKLKCKPRSFKVNKTPLRCKIWTQLAKCLLGSKMLIFQNWLQSSMSN